MYTCIYKYEYNNYEYIYKGPPGPRGKPSYNMPPGSLNNQNYNDGGLDMDFNRNRGPKEGILYIL